MPGQREKILLEEDDDDDEDDNDKDDNRDDDDDADELPDKRRMGLARFSAGGGFSLSATPDDATVLISGFFTFGEPHEMEREEVRWSLEGKTHKKGKVQLSIRE